MNSLPKDPYWLTAIIEGSGVGTWIWNVQTGETQFNSRWAEIIGYSLEEISPVSIETWMAYAHPEDLARSGELLEAHFNGETEFYDCEARMRHKDGHWVWVRDHGKLVTRTEDGKPEWVAGSHLDITAEKEHQLGLSRLQKLSKTVPGVIYEFWMNEKGEARFPFASDGLAAIYGVTPEQVREDATLAFSAIHPDDLPEVQRSIMDSFHNLTEWHTEYRTVVNGKERWVRGHSVPERHADGSVSWFGQIVDATADKRLELKLHETNTNLELAQRIGRLGYWRANMQTGDLFWSDMIYEIFGVDKKTFTPSVDAFSKAVHPDDIALVRESERRAEVTGVHDVVHRIILPNGHIRWVHELADLSVSEDNIYLVGTVRDVTEQKSYELELERLSLTDELTGAYNRRYLNLRLERALELSRHNRSKSAVVILDLDHFKGVNDKYGHVTGDLILKQLVDMAHNYFRDSDCIVRAGGEEFCVLLDDCSLDEAAKRTEGFLELFGLSDLKGADSQTIRVTFTAGVSELRSDDKSIESCLKRADAALYQGKKSGRNRVVVAP